MQSSTESVSVPICSVGDGDGDGALDSIGGGDVADEFAELTDDEGGSGAEGRGDSDGCTDGNALAICSAI